MKQAKQNETKWISEIQALLHSLINVHNISLFNQSLCWMNQDKVSLHAYQPPQQSKVSIQKKNCAIVLLSSDHYVLKKEPKTNPYIITWHTQTSSQIPIQEERIGQFWEYLYHCHYHDCKGSSLKTPAPAIPHVRKKLAPKLLMLASYPTITTKSASSSSSSSSSTQQQQGR
jgi:hypothetical protein